MKLSLTFPVNWSQSFVLVSRVVSGYGVANNSRGEVVPKYRDFLLETEAIMRHLIDSNMLENIVEYLLDVRVKGLWLILFPNPGQGGVCIK